MPAGPVLELGPDGENSHLRFVCREEGLQSGDGRGRSPQAKPVECSGEEDHVRRPQMARASQGKLCVWQGR